jgi:transcriptional regulator with XRE-family HTH domain
VTDGRGPVPATARHLFGAELRRLRQSRGLSQEEMAARVMYSRNMVTAVELGERWPPHDLAVRCDDHLRTDGTLARLWPLVDAERQVARRIVGEAKLADLRELVLRLAVLTGTDLAVLAVDDAEQPR